MHKVNSATNFDKTPLTNYRNSPEGDQIFMNKKLITNEILGGITTFLAMSYIVIANPQIVSSPGTGVTFSSALTGTVFISFLLTLIAGLFIKLPYAIAPGMGLNILIVFSFVIPRHIPWNTCMGIILLSGILFFIISVTPIRKYIIQSIPENLKHGIICGVGVFLAYIGFKNLGLLQPNHDTIVKISSFNFSTFMGIIGFIIAFYLHYKRKSYAFIVSVIIVTMCAILFKKVSIPSHIFSPPDFSNFFQINLKSALSVTYISCVLSILITNVFDATATLMTVSKKGNFINAAGDPIKLKRSLIVDSFASICASVFGTTPGVIYLESSAGIEMGARTGFASITTAILFLPCLFAAPFLEIIPPYAVAPVLIFVGILMTTSLKNIINADLFEIISLFFTIVFMPLSSSITVGVFSGILSYLLLKIIAGEWKKISIPLYIVGFCCFSALILEYYL